MIVGRPAQSNTCGCPRAPSERFWHENKVVLMLLCFIWLDFHFSFQEKEFTGDSVIVAVKQCNLLATAFHPELTSDSRWLVCVHFCVRASVGAHFVCSSSTFVRSTKLGCIWLYIYILAFCPLTTNLHPTPVIIILRHDSYQVLWINLSMTSLVCSIAWLNRSRLIERFFFCDFSGTGISWQWWKRPRRKQHHQKPWWSMIYTLMTAMAMP